MASKFDMLLDRLPDDYKGYLIRSDFRIGIQISECLSDVDLSADERVLNALFLLFGNGCPDFDTAYSGLTWFLSCGGSSYDDNATDSGNNDNNEKNETFSFEQDTKFIYSAFMRNFGIDLTSTKMHWFKFNALLNDLGDCSLNNIIQIRSTKLKDIPRDKKSEFIRLKKKYEIKRKMTAEELAEKEYWDSEFN